MKNTTKNITLTGIGIALFVVLSLCLRVPVFENYYLCLGYIVMTVYLYSFSTMYGIIVGFVGTILYCILINGLRGMPGWAFGNIIIALIIGYIFKLTKKINNLIIRNIIIVTAVIIGTGIGILIIKSGVEYILYSQPFLLRVVTNIYAFISDSFVICISIPICQRLDVYIKKYTK